MTRRCQAKKKCVVLKDGFCGQCDQPRRTTIHQSDDRPDGYFAIWDRIFLNP